MPAAPNIHTEAAKDRVAIFFCASWKKAECDESWKQINCTVYKPYWFICLRPGSWFSYFIFPFVARLPSFSPPPPPYPLARPSSFTHSGAFDWCEGSSGLQHGWMHGSISIWGGLELKWEAGATWERSRGEKMLKAKWSTKLWITGCGNLQLVNFARQLNYSQGLIFCCLFFSSLYLVRLFLLRPRTITFPFFLFLFHFAGLHWAKDEGSFLFESQTSILNSKDHRTPSVPQTISEQWNASC